MRYPSVKATKSFLYKIAPLKGGLSKGTDAAVLADGMLSESKNMWFKNDALAVRKGLNTTEQSVFYDSSGGEDIYKMLQFSDTFAVLDGVSCRIGYFVTGDITSYNDSHIVLLTPQGEIQEIGVIRKSRISYDNYPIVDHINFFVGKGKRGCGIYAMLNCYSQPYNEPSYEIYECSADKSSWILLQDSDFYVPIIYINGRGNEYDFAEEHYTETPYELESQNMLTGAFRAYFSSDNYSYRFDLPVSNIDTDKSVICRVYQNNNEYVQWTIPAGSTQTNAVYNGVNITMKCNHLTGRITFYTGDSTWPVWTTGQIGSNNIVFTANKTESGSQEGVLSCRRSAVHNSRIFLCDNQANPATVYSARMTNPLYFPKNASVTLGDPASPVRALGVQNDKLVAFKENEIHRIISNNGRFYNTNAYLPERSTEIVVDDEVYSMGVHTQIGCDCPNTLKLCGSRLVWLNSSGKVYVLATTTYGKENNVYEVSSAITELIKSHNKYDFRGAIAAEYDGYYFLFLGDGYETPTVLLMDYRVKSFGQSGSYLGSKSVDRNLAWYLWDFPRNVIISSVANTFSGFVFALRTIGNRTLYTATLGGEFDRLLKDGQIVEYPIDASFATTLYDCGIPYNKKCLHGLFVTAAASNPVEISIENERRTLGVYKCYLQDFIRTVRVGCRLRGINRFLIRVKAQGYAEFAPFGVGVEY